MSEARVTEKLRKANPEWLWKPISDKFGAGTPDRCVLWRGRGKVAWGEAKCLETLPKRSCKVNLKPRQAAWLEEWQQNGGFSFLVIGFEEQNKVAMFFSDFSRIAHQGVLLEEIELIAYEDVTLKLKSLVGG